MLIDRREFLASVGAAAVQRPAGFAAGEQILRALVFTGSSGTVELGVGVGLAEARRMGELLGTDWRSVGSHASSAAPMVSALPLRRGIRPAMYSVRASAEAKERALQLWRQRNPHGGAVAVEWHPALEKFGAEQLNARLVAAGRRPDADIWAGWMAVKVVAEALLRNTHPSLDATLLSLAYDGHKGMPLRFDPQDRHLRQPVYIVSPEGRVLGTVNPEGDPL
jgi:hypothetical protein